MYSSRKGYELVCLFFLFAAIHVGAQGDSSIFPEEAQGFPASFPEEAQGFPASFPEEAPESLLAITLNDTNVELFLKGSWQAELAHNGILQWSPFLYSVHPLLFNQIPDLYIYLAIEQSYWFEAQIGNDAANNKFAAGYIHTNGGNLVSLRLGNNGISMESYPFLGIGNPSSSFGMKADIFDINSGDRTELLIRWDSVKEETSVFYGTTELASASVDPALWLRGKAFRLPPGSVLTAVYTDAEAGTRELFPDSYMYEASRGLLILDSPASNKVRVLYTYNGITEATTVYVPGAENPLELKNYYSLGTGNSESSIIVRDNDSNGTAGAFSVHSVDSSSFYISRNNALDPALDDYAKPFNETPWIYEASATGDKSSRYTIVINTTEDRDAIRLPLAAIPGSLTVYRNGVETTSYTYDAESGKLDLQPKAQPNEEIRITYKMYSSLRENGRIVIGAGSTHSLDDSRKLKFILSGTVLVPEQVLLSSIEKVESAVEFSSEQSYGGDINGKTRFSFAARYAVKAEYARTADNRWLSGNLHLTAGSPVQLTEATGTISDILETSVGFAIADPLPAICFTKADTADTSMVVLYEADAMLADYSKLVLLLKKNSGDPSALLSLSGGTGATGFSISDIPVGAFPEGEWMLLVIDYRNKGISIFREDGSEALYTGIELSVPLDPALVQSLYCTISAANVSFDLCEPLLWKPVPSFGARQEGLLQWINADTLDIMVQEQGFWQYSTENQILARFTSNIRWNPDFFSSVLHGSFVLGEGNIIPAFGYSLASPPASRNFFAKSEFSYESDSVTRGLMVSLAKYLPFSLSVSDKLNTDLAKQKLSLKLGKTRVFFLSADLRQDSVRTEGNEAFEFLYLDSWRFLWPLSADNPYFRQLLVTAEQTPSGLLSNAKTTYSEEGEFPLRSDLDIAFAPTLTFAFGTLTIKARKAFTVSQASNSTGIVDDALSWLDAAKAVGLSQWTWDPFWSAAYATRIAEVFSGLGTGAFSDAYGLVFQRPLGLGLWDIAVPAEIAFEGYSKVTNARETAVQKTGVRANMTAKAVNIFAQYGAFPLFSSFDFDEYQWSLQGEFFSFPLQQTALYYSLSGQVQLELQGKSTIRAKSALALSMLESGMSFSADTLFALELPVEKNGVSWIADGIYNSIPAKAEEEISEKQFSSLWLSRIASEVPKAKDRWQMSLHYETSATSSTLELRQKYSAEASLAKALLITFYTEFGQIMVWQADVFAFSVEYGLGLVMKATF